MTNTAPPPPPGGSRTFQPLPRRLGVQIIGVGAAVPERLVTNRDLEKIMDTSDEWIVQRTGIRERHIHSPEAGESSASLATAALRNALADASLTPTDLDLILVATMTEDMPTPSVGCIVADRIGAGSIAAIDINAACSGFVYSMNVAHAMVQSGLYRTLAVIGADTITQYAQFSTFGRGVAVLFGDAAAGLILRATDDTSKGLIAQAMHTDGSGSRHLLIPKKLSHLSPPDNTDERKVGLIHMNGQAVFKFAVSTFPKLIEETLAKANLTANDVDHYVCHQSNFRILDAARERFGLAPEKLHVNIDRYGNTVAASIPLILNELKQGGRLHEGQKVMFLAFGAGLTWGSSLWQL